MPNELNYVVHDLEPAAVFFALKLWRHYLMGRLFKIFSNHKSFKYLFTQKELKMRQHRLIEYITGYDSSIDNCAVKRNVLADALS